MSLAETNLHSNHCVILQCIEAIRSSLKCDYECLFKGRLGAVGCTSDS